MTRRTEEIYQTVLRAKQRDEWVILDSDEDLKTTVIEVLLRAKTMSYPDSADL